jgi:serine/threonine protein kinase
MSTSLTPKGPRDVALLDQPTADTQAPGEAHADTGVTAFPKTTPQTLVGRAFGDFELLHEIGLGGMGIVFKARQKSLDRIVALKMLLAEHIVDPVRLVRFQAEARIVAGLSHPNIVNVFQVGECEYGRFFAMEYVDGRTLEAVILEKKQIPAPWAVNLLIGVAEAVHYAHCKGVVHRDLKPANIMIDRFRRPIVMDFGIAKCVGKSVALTQPGAIMGTPAYMAPDQAGDNMTQVGPASDVYSMGAILYTLLTGKLPYEGATPLETILKVIDEVLPAPVCCLRPDVPEELEVVCMKCLSKKPGDRFPTAQALVEALRRFRASPPSKKRAGATTGRREPAAATVREELAELLAVVLFVQATRKEIYLDKPSTLIGRAPECSIVLRAADVSKHHCRLLIEADRVMVEDLGSANGTYVNGRPVQRARLRHGDKLHIAEHVMEVRVHRPIAAEASQKIKAKQAGFGLGA